MKSVKPAKQLSLFELEPESNKGETLTGIVYPDPEGRGWIAELCGGWYMAIGKTKKSAIDSVIRQYEREMEFQN